MVGRWVGLGLATIAVAFWRLRIIAPANILMFGASDDPYTQIYPMAYRAARWMAEGQLPLWNPYQFSGHPFLACVLYGIFYPPNLIFLVLPTEYAMEASAAFHLSLAAIFMYAYLRELGLAVVAAVGGALTFALSGFVTSQALWFLPAVGAAVWLPFGLLAIERLVKYRSRRWAAGLAVAVAMPVLAGWLQLWVYTMYALGGYLGFRILTQLRVDGRADVVRAAVLGGGAIVVGLALAAVQLLPSAELQGLGPRQPGGLTIAQSLSSGPMPFARLLTNAIDPRAGFPRPNYVGILTLLLIPVTLLAARLPRVWFFWALAAAAALVALTIQTPFFTLFRLLPSSTWFRYPDRILFLYVAAAGVLVGHALDLLLRAAPRSRPAVLAPALATVAALAWIAFAGLHWQAVAYMAVGLAVLWATALVTSPAQRTAIVAALVLLHTVDLFRATSSPALHPYHDLTVLDGEHEVLDNIQRTQGYARTYIHYGATNLPAIMPKQGTLRGIYTITDYEPLSLKRTGRLYRAADPRTWGPDDPPFIGLINIRPTVLGRRVLDLLGVRFAVVPKADLMYGQSLVQAGWTPTLVSKTGLMTQYTNPAALPRAYVVHEAVHAGSEDEAFAAVTAPTFPLRRSVVLESPAGPNEPAPPATAASASFPGAEIVRYEPDRVDVRVDDPTPGWLVLSDTWYPGWTAEIDGTPVAIERANFLFRAVRTNGAGTVTFRYRPASFRNGALLSACALLVLVGAVVSDRRRAS